MIIRPATFQDTRAIADFWNPMIRNTAVTFNSIEKSADDVAEMVTNRHSQGYAFDVAEAGGEILGFATYSQFRGGVGYARTMEHTVILAPAAQGRGAGRALLKSIEDHARRGGAHSMFAGVSSENPDGVAFHLAVGYKEIALLFEVGRKFDRWMNLHLLQKLL